MFGRNKNDRFVERLKAQYEINPLTQAAIRDPDFHGTREFLPAMEAPPVFPESAVDFFAHCAIRLKAEGMAEEADKAWPFLGKPEEYLQAREIDPIQ